MSQTCVVANQFRIGTSKNKLVAYENWFTFSSQLHKDEKREKAVDVNLYLVEFLLLHQK